MSITAVICEYNPFHKGHKYQLDEIKRLCPNSTVVSVMSPNFVQRGRPAILDKYIRGECAIRSGADLAVSMPVVFSLLSAEGFAEAGVKTALRLGADTLAFGVESTDIEGLCKIAKALISSKFDKSVKEAIEASPADSFPKVRQKALQGFVGKENSELIAAPNNILAVEYIKAIYRFCPEMKILPIKRIGSGYSDTNCDGEFLSATAIRIIESNKGDISPHIPSPTVDTVNGATRINETRYNDFLMSVITVADYDKIISATGNKELADIIFSSIRRFGDYTSFRSAISRRKFNETAIDRALSNIILGIKKDAYMHIEPNYVTLLGANANGRKVIKSTGISVISKFKSLRDICSTQAETEMLADRIWARCSTDMSGEQYFVDKKPFTAEEIK